MNKKDHIILLKDDFWKIYDLIDNIKLDEERIIGILEYIDYISKSLYEYIKHSKLKKWILKYIIGIDLEYDLKVINEGLSEMFIKYLGIYHIGYLKDLDKVLEKIKDENGLNESSNESKNG
jgi:hypothetical protein